MRNVLILVIAHNLQIVLRGITEEYASANQAILEIRMELLALLVRIFSNHLYNNVSTTYSIPKFSNFKIF